VKRVNRYAGTPKRGKKHAPGPGKPVLSRVDSKGERNEEGKKKEKKGGGGEQEANVNGITRLWKKTRELEKRRGGPARMRAIDNKVGCLKGRLPTGKKGGGGSFGVIPTGSGTNGGVNKERDVKSMGTKNLGQYLGRIYHLGGEKGDKSRRKTKTTSFDKEKQKSSETKPFEGREQDGQKNSHAKREKTSEERTKKKRKVGGGTRAGKLGFLGLVRICREGNKRDGVQNLEKSGSTKEHGGKGGDEQKKKGPSSVSNHAAGQPRCVEKKKTGET